MNHDITNKKIEQILNEMADLYRMKDVDFKPRAYENAALAVQKVQQPLTDIYQASGKDGLTAIEDIGDGIADHIVELIETGHFEEYEALKDEIPVDIAEMTAVEGVGPKTVYDLYKQLDVTTLEEMGQAAVDEKIQTMDGYGKKSEENIKEAIVFYKSHHDRFLLGDVKPAIDDLLTSVRDLNKVEKAAVAGSIRRWRETVGDADILVVAADGPAVIGQFCDLQSVVHVYEQGDTKASVRLSNEVDADLRVVSEDSWGAALNYFTGSKAHNVTLRTIAQRRGWTLNEYGLFEAKDDTAEKSGENDADTDPTNKGKRIAGKDEKKLYDALEMSYIPPELREDRGEIEAAKREYQGSEDGLPDLIEYNDLCGDLQMHTTASDGSVSIKEMAAAAAELGHEYIAITDHTQALAMAGGLDADELRAQIQEVNKVNEQLQQENIDITVLAGTEVDIFADGSLDMSDDVLAQLDIVGAAVHSKMGLSEEKQTKRVITAMQHPQVDIIFHLTARRLKKRNPIELHIDQIIEGAKETGTVLEIDASPERLDINDQIIRKCVDAGVKMSINSDAHAPEHLDFVQYGIGQARRGWASKEDIINTRSLEALRDFLNK